MPSKSVSIQKPAIIDDDETSHASMSSPQRESVIVSSAKAMTTLTDPSVSEPTLPCIKTKLKKPEGRPKRPLSAYNVFFQFARAKLLLGEDLSVISQQDFEKTWSTIEPSSKEKRPHRKSHGKISFREMARTVAAKWKVLDGATKAIFEERVRIDRQRYMFEMEIWKRGSISTSPYPYAGFAAVSPEIRRQLIDQEIAHYQATQSSHVMLPALTYRATCPPQPHRVSLPMATVAPPSAPVMCQHQVNNYPAYQQYAVPNEHVSAFHMSQQPIYFKTTSTFPLNVSSSTASMQSAVQPRCYYTTAVPFMQPIMLNQCVVYRNIHETNCVHPPQRTLSAMHVQPPQAGMAIPNQQFVANGNHFNKVEVDQEMYRDDIGAFSDDEEDLFESFE